MQIPERTVSTKALINQHYEKNQEPPRPHLGVSQIGHKCDRYLWYSFRWAVVEKFDGRILRLFQRGHNEEFNFVRDLRAIGVDIRNTNSSQSKVDFGCHVSGSIDGIIQSGLPEAPTKQHVAEFKTHSKKSFDDLVKNGLLKSKPMHYIQLNTYMYGMKIDRGFYMAVCKDNDEIYTERIELDKEMAEKYINRAKRITMLDRKPEPMSADQTWYECSYCPAKSMCHDNTPTKEVNCRTCVHSTAKEDSTWYCEKWQDVIPLDAQRTGCDSHVLHLELVPYEFRPAKDEWSAIYIINGKEVLNGADGFKSSEIVANPDECANPSDFTKELRETMGAVIV